ncbi:hypothetical protein KBX08_32930 [Micromonospora sp. H61]|uniref:hypothetical protein n=1 Tax=Micromonospora sp. H61 TaxID=2824888 RepID=UPI001B369FE3|nr:hypothetical protein [Micromonospora sp. H61]MBQ0994859.1 hypothetical protein [Micromonospora sp. H61]
MTGLIAAVGAFVGVRLSVRGNDRATVQRDIAARREEWWRRFTWAAELAHDDSPASRAAGLRVLTQLALSELSQRDEHLILHAFPAPVLRESELDGHTGTTEEQVAAAQMMIVLDRKLGYDTPKYVRRMAGQSRLYYASARRARRVHTTLQASALGGSIVTASLIGAGAGDSLLLWGAAAGNALAATATGLLLYFKFKDREINLLLTAEAIDDDLALAEQGK